LQAGFDYTDQQLRGQPGLTVEELYVLELVLGKGSLWNESITLEDLEKAKTKEFRELLPILEKLVQQDLLRRLPSET